MGVERHRSAGQGGNSTCVRVGCRGRCYTLFWRLYGHKSHGKGYCCGYDCVRAAWTAAWTAALMVTTALPRDPSRMWCCARRAGLKAAAVTKYERFPSQCAQYNVQQAAKDDL